MIFLCLSCHALHAQVFSSIQVRPCGSDVLQQRLRKDPAYVAREAAIERAILARSYHTAPFSVIAPPPIVTLPVVFHIIDDGTGSITDANVIQALNDLNDAYGATGAFTGARTDTRIRFCLAKTAPDGSRTNGIVRTKSYLSDFDVDMEGGELLKLGRWPGDRYINIWVVQGIKSEYMQDFECGNWTRLHMGGYASAGGDIVVAGLGVGLVAHEMGHYLNLLHTFANRDCKNDDCTVDGDKVCDTPPERSITGGYACSSPPNTCHTDTLSGFTTDVPDLPDNFMDYGQGAGCILSFTAGQAQRMQNFIAAALGSLVASAVCNDPCTAAITAGFTRSIDYPVIGDVINFTNTSTGADTYQWIVDGVPQATTTNFSLTVTEKRNYTVWLRATNTAAHCSATLTDVITVGCGVTARFYPDKRKIASKAGFSLDSVQFTNRSRNATAWTWLMSNDAGMAETAISSSQQLTYVFTQPATYNVRLVATDGHCYDTTNVVHIVVDDPRPNGAVFVPDIQCYDKDKLRVSLYFYNYGYDTIPKNTPVAFYDADPRKPGAHRVGGLYQLPSALPGKCASALYTFILDAGRADIDTLVAVFNDNGTTLPLALPNTSLIESDYNNNISSHKNFQFHVKLTPADYTLAPQQQITLKPLSSGGVIDHASWQVSPWLDCSNCINSTFTAPYRQDSVVKEQVMAFSKYGCVDSTTATIHLPPADDYTVKTDQADCAAGDSLHLAFTICNAYTKGNIPSRLSVDFYDAPPASGGATALGTTFVTLAQSAGACEHYEQFIKRPVSGSVYALVNKAALTTTFPPGSGLNEANYANNTSGYDYHAPVLSVFPLDTTVYRKAPFPLYYSVPGFSPVQIAWQHGDGYTLSCYNCASPQATMRDSAAIGLQVTNQYGCTLQGQNYVHLFPPDMTVELLEVHCFDNSHITARFRICMSNGYDSVFAQVPVSFYDGDPGNDNTHLLSPAYATPLIAPGACAEYTHILAARDLTSLVAVVNQPAKFNETNYLNNRADIDYTPFRVSVDPPYEELYRPASIWLHSTVAGDHPISYAWEPALGLSCTSCAAPVASVTSSMKYTVLVKNEYFCTDTAAAVIKTFTGVSTSMPNAFTPNGDGHNDIFYVIGSRDIKLVRDFNIFDRWGGRVFEAHNTPANDRAYGWDGSVNGREAAAGPYVYFATLEFMDGTVQMIKGSLVLVR